MITVNIWKGIPFYTILLLAGLKAIDREQYEAAEVDGAGAISRFRHITLPGLKYVILVTVLLSFSIYFLPAANRALTAGTVAAFVVYVGQIYQPLAQLTNARVYVLTTLVSFERVFELLMGNDVAPRKDFIVDSAAGLDRERIDA